MKIVSRKKLGDLLEEYKDKNTGNKYKPVAVGRYGIRKREDIYSKELAKDYSKNKIIYKHTLTVGMGSKQIDIGILTEDVIYAVSPAYHTFKISNINSNYLRYCLEARNADMSERFMIASARQGKSVDFKKMLKYEIPIYSEADTNSILYNLGLIEDIILNLDNQIERMDLLLKSRFIEMFGDPVENEMGWNTLPLEKACEQIVDCPHSTPKYTEENTGYMCIRTSIVKRGSIMWDEIEYISKDEYEQRIRRKKPQKDDIVYTREGGILGIAAIIDRECDVALGQRSMLLSPDKEKCLPEYLCTTMNMESFFNKMTEGVIGSAAPHINVGDIKAFNIMLPPVDAQKEFIFFQKQIDKSKMALQEMKAKMEILKASVMQKYFC